jgi:phosphoenolpyruvate carboxykinase (GTP)
LPAPGALDVSNVRVSETAVAQLLKVDVEGWNTELQHIRQHYDRFGSKLPAGLREELAALEQRLTATRVSA